MRDVNPPLGPPPAVNSANPPLPSDAYHGQARRTDGTYGAPRRYSLKTIVAVTTVFAGFFGLLVSAGASPPFIIFLASFFVIVGMAQAWLYGGRRPRASSTLAGAGFGLAFGILIGCLILFPPQDLFTFFAFTVLALSYTMLGMILGYLVGCLTASLFMLLTVVDEFWDEDPSATNVEEHQQQR